MTFEPMADRVPVGAKGLAYIKHLVIDSHAVEFMALRAMVSHGREEATPEGRYCQLYVGSTLMMSDTAMERRTNREVVRRATGHVFIAGLGIGMILVPILAKPEVTSVTVVEKYQDVIDLVGPNFQNPKLSLVCADVFKYVPPKETKYSVIYHDIWPDLSTDQLDEMRQLHARYRKYLAPGGWQESWRREDLKRMKRSRRSYR